MRGRSQSTFANPVLVGAVTVLALMVTVFLAYSANQGLPFVPTKQIKVEVADGSNLVIGNDVREGGFRIGLVSNMKPVQLPNGHSAAQLTLQLDKANGNVPVNSHVTILPRSVLGLKYVDLQRGTSKKVFPDGATMPITQTTVPVQFDDIFKTFDTKTRHAIQKNLAGYGNVLAARGSALNDTIASLPRLFGYLQPVASYLANSRTTRFFDSLNRFMGAIAPVAQVNARLFTDMATTFAAISSDPNALEQTIAKSPSTLDVSTNSLKVQQPFLADLTTLGHDFTPATHELNLALPQLNPAIDAGTVTLARTPSLNHNLQEVMRALKSLSQAPSTNIALNALVSTVSTLNPMVKYLGPYQTVCDSWNYWWTFLSEHISEETSFGFAQRALFNQGNPLQPNGLGAEPASQPINGGTPGGDSPMGGNGYLHGPAYGAAVSNSGQADCEIGQRGYVRQLNHFDPQHRLFHTDPHTPGNQGPTFKGRRHVPAGETFSRNPLFGAQLPSVPGNN